MRFARLAAVLAACVVVGTGCGDAKKSTSAPAASPGATASAAPGGQKSGVDAAVNTKAVCAAAKSAIRNAVDGMRAPLAEMVQAQTKDDTAGVQAAQAKVRKLFADTSVKLDEQAKQAGDEKLKATLVNSATAYRNAGEAFGAGDDDALVDPTFNAAGDGISDICGA